MALTRKKRKKQKKNSEKMLFPYFLKHSQSDNINYAYFISF